MKFASYLSAFVFAIFYSSPGLSQVNPYQDEQFWEVSGEGSIVWNLTQETRLPHSDNMEMDGQQVAGIIHYTVDEDRGLELVRHLIFPSSGYTSTRTGPGGRNTGPISNTTMATNFFPLSFATSALLFRAPWIR